MLEFSLTVELIVTLLVYFFVHFILIFEIVKKFKMGTRPAGYIFTQSIIFVNIISLFLVFLRLITLTIPQIPFFEQYIIKGIYLPANFLLPDFINPFIQVKSLPTFTTLMINTFCTILLIYHVLAQIFLLKFKNWKNIAVVMISSIFAYICSIISVITIHFLIQMIDFY